MPSTESKRGSNAPTFTPAATRFLLWLSDQDYANEGECQVCHEYRAALVDLFPAAPGGEIQPQDRLVCPQCLALARIAEAAGVALD